MKKRNIRTGLACMLVLGLTTGYAAAQGGLTPSDAPTPTMKTLQEIWDKLDEQGAAIQGLVEEQAVLKGFLVSMGEVLGLHMDWLIAIVDGVAAGESPGDEPCMRLAQDGYPAVAHHDDTTQELCYSKYNGSIWIQRRFSDPTYDVGVFPSLAFDEDGYPLISCRRPGAQDLLLARYNGATWSMDPLYTAGNAGLYSSIVCTSGGLALVAFSDDGDLKVGWEDPGAVGGWSFRAVDTDSTAGTGCSMALPPGGSTPGVSYICSSVSPSSAWLKYAKLIIKNGDVIGQTIMTVDSSIGAFSYDTSLAYTPGDQPAIAYYSNGGPALKYAEYNGTSWDIAIVDDSGLVGKGCSLAFNPEGRPTITYHDQDEASLRYAVFDGAAWQLSKVDDDGNATSLLYLPDSTPAVAYDGGGKLKYAYLRSERLLP